MTPEYLGRIRVIYESALAKDAAERNAFLVQACQGDDAIRREVELLLGARERVPNWMNEPLLAPAPSFDSVPRMEGRELSGYRLMHEIGSGGMGSVYLAERSDGAFRKQVAIKIIQPGMKSANIAQRFRQEREILASLDHPGIARLLDAGATGEGLPYFVMEFVDGQPIDRWCDERKLNVTQRLELFRAVCEAVQYAHQRLVVHRDLKPGNILVTADGTVKLLDFGIAKLLHQQQANDPESTRTRTLMQAMTPEYASPEQVNGGSITTLTDVYSLGVVLYELLTGHRPHHLLRAAVREMARIVSEEEPMRPSMAVATTEERLTPMAVSEVREGNPIRLRKRLEGDLDWILLTALHSEPVRRYGSVEAFGEDLGRHLANQPVKARGDSLLYRTSRFVRRHPGKVVAGTLIIFSVVAGLLTTLWESRILTGLGQVLPGHVILAPQLALFLYIALVGFAIAVYLTRAKFVRAIGALAGGAVYGLCWLLKLKIGSSMGWWRSRFSTAPDSMELFAQPVFLPTLAFAGAAFFLISWRVTRRFGWPWQVFLIFAVAGYQAVRERIWFDTLMRVMAARPGIVPLLGDAVLLAAGLALGYGVMRLIVGSAHKDPLARNR
ncbi:MAG: serine/threonine protein kinase [Acidobacteriota bacterium]|nr:serine/threonine protein kinase [Acidobacteriota bacterium]